ncbi:MAG: hypothetical protein ACHP8A_12620 [Terriglobales bacterium]
MDLIDSYVKAVAKALPEGQREDIVDELSEDIRSEMEEKQKELGRPLTEEEQEGLLRQRGNPLLLAARYRQDQRSVAFGRQIIGPVLFPFYVKVLSFNLGLTFLVVAIIFMALAVSGQKIGFNDIVSTCLLQLFIQLSIVTLIFALVERNLTKHPDRWNVKGMGGKFRLDLNIERDIRRGTGSNLREVSRFESVSIIVACAVAIGWMTGVQNFPFLILGPAAAFLKLAPIWYQIYFPIVALTSLEIVRAIINLVHPDWVRFRAWYGVFVQAAGLVIVYFLIKAGSWVEMANSAGGAVNFARTVEIINQVFLYALVATAVFSGVMLLIRVMRLIRQPGGDNGSTSVGARAKEGN